MTKRLDLTGRCFGKLTVLRPAENVVDGFRQHTSRQGGAVLPEGGKKRESHSVFELVLLMDSALGGCEEGAA